MNWLRLHRLLEYSLLEDEDLFILHILYQLAMASGYYTLKIHVSDYKGQWLIVVIALFYEYQSWVRLSLI